MRRGKNPYLNEEAHETKTSTGYLRRPRKEPRSKYGIRPDDYIEDKHGYVLEHSGRARLWFPTHRLAELALKLAKQDERRRLALHAVDPTVELVPRSEMHHHHTAESLHQRVWELHLSQPEVRIKQTLRQLLAVYLDAQACTHIQEYWEAAHLPHFERGISHATT